MDQRNHRSQISVRAAQAAGLTLLAFSLPALAQTSTTPQPTTWQQCAAVPEGSARLACFDNWARTQAQPTQQTAPGTSVPAASALTTPPAAPAEPVNAQLPATRVIEVAATEGCKDTQYSALSRFWELEEGSDCGTFNFRGYRPISLSWIASDTVNTAPSSPSPGHTATFTPYQTNELRLQLSVRTKIAQGLLTGGDPSRKDSLWIGYTQQSYWQFFNGDISRPFRTTDHEPEVVYVYPLDLQFGNGLRLRYGGVGLVHQSNGQTLPLSRSWNRVYLMAGLESGNKWNVNARIWRRMSESSGNDDNPDISSYIGRAELNGNWFVNKDNTLSATLRTSLGKDSNGSVRLEWLRAIGSTEGRRSGLHFHTQFFSGYGDSLVDYNRRRNVLSIGLSLLDF